MGARGRPGRPIAAAVLAAFGLAAGVGLGAVGPGGVLVTVGLLVATRLSPTAVAGTAIATNLAAGVLGSAVYRRSGELRDPETRRVALILAAAAVAGTPVGVLVNSAAPTASFGILLAAFLVLVAMLVGLRSSRVPVAEAHPHHQATLLICLGVGVAMAGGMFGVGGPLLAVPLLVALGTPMLPALGAAQAQSVVIAAVGTLSYLLRDAIDWHLALVAGIPELGGVLIGWRVAKAVAPSTLRGVMILGLLVSAAVAAGHG